MSSPVRTHPVRFLDRRDFLKVSTAAAAAGASLAGLPSFAADATRSSAGNDPWDNYIPADKHLRPEWVKSLFEPGKPTTYAKSRSELRYLGMPVGGLCCGTLYIGGDGRLWLWDIFNQNREGVTQNAVPWSEVGLSFASGDMVRARDGANFVKPPTPPHPGPVEQGFALRVKQGSRTITRRLDESAWTEIEFTGQYPVATVRYTDPECPVSVKLEAFSPFIPLNAEDSSLPATLFRFTVRNTAAEAVQATLAGWLQNATSLYSARSGSGRRINQLVRGEAATSIAMRFQPAAPNAAAQRPDIVVDDFESGYSKWTVEGSAFGTQPASRAVIPPYQGDVGGEGAAVVNSHATAPGSSVGEKDAAAGRLTSRPFRLERRYLRFYVGGGANRQNVGIRLKVDGQVVATSGGRDQNRMHLEHFDIAKHEGREGVLEIYDNGTAGWGNVGIDQIVQTDVLKEEVPLEKRGDFGTMALTFLGNTASASCNANIENLPDTAFDTLGAEASAPPEVPILGALATSLQLGPGESKDLTFAITWHFPNTRLPVPDARSGNYYTRRFADAAAVAAYVGREHTRLSETTRLWAATWADSTLPQWFLERTFATASTLATTTCHRFTTGRFWAWEGIGCCEGTCTHVWHYAQAMGRLFPEIERDLRERVDFGVGFDDATGTIRHRAEGTGPAIDGQCGRILGAWREHQTSSNGAFLRRVWPKVRRATQHLLDHDTDRDGLIDGAQENTLDAAWFGQIAWISSLAVAALTAAAAMAEEMGDPGFAATCRERATRGRTAIETRLWNGEYFIHLPEPGKEKNLGTYQGCHIDQVFGQGWAWQVGLGRILDRDKTLSALKALWKYNFSPDVGPFRKKMKEGRPYALAGDAGLVMSTNLQRIPDAFGGAAWQSGYFNECMSGFEHQAASHMMAEGLVQEALAITRAIHDRYHGSRRNPWNEVECSDHYARAMAAYGTFISACGFEHHGPSGHIGFAPRLQPANFRAAFTAAGAWGTFAQKIDASAHTARIEVKWGTLRLKTLALEAAAAAVVPPTQVQATLGALPLKATLARETRRLLVTLSTPIEITAGGSLEVRLG